MKSDFTAGKFVKESYDQNNLIGKQLLVAYLFKNGYNILPETFSENYGVDIVAEKNGKKIRFEVEMKGKYNFHDMNTFPFDTVSFLARKEKWKNDGFVYCIINKSNYCAISCHSDIIFNADYLEKISVDTSHRRGNDMCYRVPKELCKFRSPKDFYISNYERIWEHLLSKI